VVIVVVDIGRVGGQRWEEEQQLLMCDQRGGLRDLLLHGVNCDQIKRETVR
jgi:hypothetical protein